PMPYDLQPSATASDLPSSPTRRSSDLPLRAGEADAPEAARRGLLGDDLGDVQPRQRRTVADERQRAVQRVVGADHEVGADALQLDRKSTRLNSSHVKSSYAVFCLKKKN